MSGAAPLAPLPFYLPRSQSGGAGKWARVSLAVLWEAWEDGKACRVGLQRGGGGEGLVGRRSVSFT